MGDAVIPLWIARYVRYNATPLSPFSLLEKGHCTAQARNASPTLSPGWSIHVLLCAAYAKLNGSYQEIIAGSPAEALHSLTTAPTERFPAEDTDELWEKLVKAEKRGWPTMATTKNIPGLDAEKSVGLVEGHAYAVLNAKEVSKCRLSRPFVVTLCPPLPCNTINLPPPPHPLICNPMPFDSILLRVAHSPPTPTPHHHHHHPSRHAPMLLSMSHACPPPSLRLWMPGTTPAVHSPRPSSFVAHRDLSATSSLLISLFICHNEQPHTTHVWRAWKPRLAHHGMAHRLVSKAVLNTATTPTPPPPPLYG